MRHISR